MTQQTNSKTGKKTMWILIAAAAAVLVALVLCYVLFADNKDKDPASDQNPGDIGDISYTENIESSGDDVISSVNDDTLPDENIVSGDLQADEDVPGNMDTVPESEANDDPELSSSGSGTAAKPVNVTSQPCPGRERCGKEGCYWCTPMDISDEDAVWKMLCSPITVISGDQRKQYQLRSKPNRNSTPVGDVTCESQGVHVLETLDTGWTRVETYSSSFDDSKVWANNMLVTGYVETRLLKEVKPNNSNYGLVIDKMTQRCYIFRNGKLFSILRVSTGKPNEYEPYNETQSGEFLIVCAVGNFVTEEEGLVCDMALRFNRGNMLHQVPYTLDKDENKNFDIYEAALGTRASHGCIRVQRKETPEHTNMKWLWDRRESNGRTLNPRLVIWEDCEGRYYPLPDSDTSVYINASGGKMYHRRAVCPCISEEYYPLKAIPYIDLMSPEYASLKPCTQCNPPERPETYVQMNVTFTSGNAIYLDDSNGAYYHKNPYCSLYSKSDLPLHMATLTERNSEAFASLLPCPICVGKTQNPTLYYNPKGGKRYHSDSYCSSVNSDRLPLTPFDYYQLDDPEFAPLSPCPYCRPPARGIYPTRKTSSQN